MLPILRRDARVRPVDQSASAYEITAAGLQTPQRVSKRVLRALQLLEQHTVFDAWVANVHAVHPEISREQLNRLLDEMRRCALLEERIPTAETLTGTLDDLFPGTPSSDGHGASFGDDTAKRRGVTAIFKGVGALPADAVPASAPAPAAADPFVLAVRAFESGDLPRAEELFRALERGPRAAEARKWLAHVQEAMNAAAFEDRTSIVPALSFDNMEPASADDGAATIAASRPPMPAPPQPVHADATDDDGRATAEAEGAEEPQEADAEGASVDATGQVEKALSDPAAVRRRWQRRIRRLAIIAGAIGALCVLGLVVTVPFSITYEAEVFPIERGFVRSPVEGVVASIDIEEGAKVEKGAVLGRMADSEQRLSVVKSNAAVERARAELELLRAGTRAEEVARAEAAVAGLSRELGIASQRVNRLRGLVSQGVAPRDELERARAEAASLNGELNQARANAKLLKAGSRPDEIRKKEAELRSLEAQHELDQKLLDAMKLVAPMNGIVTTRRPKDLVNNKLTLGDPVLEIAQLDRMRVEIRVNERDFEVLQKDLPIALKIAAYPTEEFTGTVTRIAQQVEKAADGNIVRVEGEVDNAGGKLVPNMSGYAEIKAGEKPVLSLLVRRVVRYMRVRLLL